MANISDFISIGAKGVEIATFAEIRDTLIDNYKAVYGDDIDISRGSVDDIYINNLALIINNVLRSVSQMYSNLDITSASGVYLDALCRLANIKRKDATPSTAKVNVANASGANYTLVNGYELTDAAGNLWQYKSADVVIANGANQDVIFTCKTLGPISAPAGSLSPIIAESNITFTQTQNAVLGTNVESDAELRSRRTQSAGAAGTTTLESLYGGLLDIADVKDVYLYNNDSAGSSTLADSRSVDAHSIYVVVARQNPNTSSPFVPDDVDKEIATVIYDRLTPGISTDTITGKTTDSGVAREIDMTTLKGNLTVISALANIDFNVRWKQATPVNPTIEITITPASTFSSDEIDDDYKQSWLNYLNSLPIGTDLTQNMMLIEVLDLDPYFNGRATYNISSLSDIKINNKNDGTPYTNELTYYNYTSVVFSSNKITIT